MNPLDESDPWEFVDFDREPHSTAAASCDLASAIESVRAEIAALRVAFAARSESAKPPSSLMTVREAATHLRLKEKALYQRVARGQVKAYRLGRALRFRRADLDALLGSLVR